MIDYSKISSHLKHARERKGLSYDQIFEVTRIQPSILKQIEEGKSGGLSSVLLKGFIKSYARALGLNPEALFKLAEEKESQNRGFEKKEEARRRRAWRFKPVFLKFTLAALGLAFVFQAARFIFREPPADQSAAKKSAERALQEESAQETPPRGPEELSLKENQSLFEKVKSGAWTKELLIKSSEPQEVYFKADRQPTVTKRLEPSVWFQIKARKSLYFRLDKKTELITIFYQGRRIDTGSDSFFEKTF